MKGDGPIASRQKDCKFSEPVFNFASLRAGGAAETGRPMNPRIARQEFSFGALSENGIIPWLKNAARAPISGGE